MEQIKYPPDYYKAAMRRHRLKKRKCAVCGLPPVVKDLTDGKEYCLKDYVEIIKSRKNKRCEAKT